MNTTGSNISSARGFTFVELMVVSLIAIIVIAGIYGVYKSMHDTWLAEDIKADMQQSTRVAMDNMVRDMMMLGYGSNPDDKIVKAERSRLEFKEYMKNASGVYKEHLLHYYKEGTNLKRYIKNLDSLEENTNTLVSNVESLSYFYYDVNDDDMGVPGTDIDKLKAIRRITVELKVKSERKIPGGDYKTMTLTADLSPRNLWEGEASMDSDAPLTVENLHVIDSQLCGTLKATWDLSSADDIAGYLLKWGTATGEYINYLDVPAFTGTDPPVLIDPQVAELSVDIHEFGTTPAPYFVIVQAYDNSHNYSAPSTEVTSTDPNVDVTSFSDPEHDTVNDIPKPAVPSWFNADNNDTNPSLCPEGAIYLTWEQTSDPNVLGYRVYRSATAFDASRLASLSVPDASIPADIKMIARETESGVPWPAEDISDVDGSNDGFYLDDDPTLNGCQTYYYAVCAVTCDRKHITGGNYDESDFATVGQDPKESTPPPSPDLTGSMAGWRRAFLTLNNPSTAACPDFERTEIYYSEGATLPWLDPDTKIVHDGVLIPDSDCATTGIFRNRGTQTVLFDSKTEVDPISPSLENEAQYNILAVSYDKCGNTSTESTTIILISLCGDDPSGPPPNSPTAASFFSCDETSVIFSWSYPPKAWAGDPESATPQIYDFAGYRLWRTDYYVEASDDTLDAVRLGRNWAEYWSDSTPIDGGTYYYTVRAVDCVYENRNSEFPYNYSDPLVIGPVQPGIAELESNLAITEGQYHNKVKFYLENASAGELQLTQMNLSWGNTAAYLKSITIGPADITTTNLVTVGAGSFEGTVVPMNNVYIKDVAGGPGLKSVKVPVTLEFANSDGTVNEFTDMRTDIVNFNYTYKKAVSSSLECITDNMQVLVTGGPSMNFTIQNRPSNPTTSFPIFGCLTTTVLPAGYPVVGGGQVVTVTTNVTVPSIEQMSDLRLKYAITDKADVSPLAYTFSSITSGTQSGNNYSTDLIPVAADEGVWFYVEARTAQGNFARSPKTDDSFFYYYQEPFDVCNEYPLPPSNVLRNTTSFGSIKWAAPTEYESGTDIPAGDTIVYDVYRRVLNGTYTTPQSDGTGVSTMSYKDTTARVAGQNYEYAVKSRNSCNNESSEFSSSVIFCGGAAGCVVSLSAAGVTLDTNWTSGSQTCTSQEVILTVFICDRAGDGATWDPNDCYQNGVLISPCGGSASYDSQSDITMTITSAANADTSNITLLEINGDSGLFTYNGGSGRMRITSLASLYDISTSDDIIGATKIDSLADILTFKTDSGITNCSLVSDTLDVTTDPCVNTPNTPVVRTASRNNKVIDYITWDAVTTNTDGSQATHVADSVTYQVWYAVTTETDLNNYTLLGTSTTTSFSTTDPATQVANSNTDYNFYVKAVDSCTPPNSSAASTPFTLTKSSIYSNP